MLQASPRHYPYPYKCDGVTNRVPLALLRRAVDLGPHNSRHHFRLPLLRGAVRREQGAGAFYTSFTQCFFYFHVGTCYIALYFAFMHPSSA